VNDPAALLSDLTDPQKQAVTHPGGPLLILAGAGSGKTRIITRRVGWLISQGAVPASILAITFTNKSAGEMKHRVAAVLDRPLRDWGRLEQPSPMICTFHSLCLRILKHYAPAIGLSPGFSVFDSADQNKLMKQALRDLDISGTNYPPAAIHAAISKAKNRLLGPEEFSQTAGDIFQRVTARVFAKYQALLKTNNALDFDDLLLQACHAMRSHPQVLAELQERFAHLLIDEYQDTNHAQYILAHALAARHRNITVVGDPDQSIYAWRGADLSNILDFEQDYPDATVVRLERNYRSTKTVLAIASELIARNRLRKDKTLWTENPQGHKALLLHCGDDHYEAAQVTARLQEFHDSGKYAWSDMAIFYRMNSLSRLMEDALRHAGIPYQIARGVEFYNRKEIKDVLAYLRSAVNPDDEVSLERIANTPTRGISDATIKLLQLHAVTAGTSLWGAMKDSARIDALSPRAGGAIQAFVKLMESFQNAARQSGVRAAMETVYQRSGLEAMLKKLDPTEENEIPNVGELISSAAEYDREHPDGSTADYLAAVSLVSDADRFEGAGGAVTLMTLHAAKGLEFPVVAIIGLEEGCLPHSRARDDVKELEEERRLCFVGITRARERLILSNAAWRTIRGRREPTIASPFLAEMPPDMLEIIDSARRGSASAREGSAFAQDDSQDLDRPIWPPRRWAAGPGRPRRF
jgi:DNA helicase-2/ATP-dependent DNA helicase PcrA